MKARENPFRTERVECVAYRLEATTWEEIFARLDLLDGRAAVVAPHGHGKTTFLEAIDREWRERGLRTHFIRLNEERRGLTRRELESLRKSILPGDAVIADGAEQLNWLAWRRFRRAAAEAAFLVISTHAEERLPTLYECRVSPSTLQWLVTEITEGEEKLDDTDAEALFAKHGGNLRDAVRDLYDRAAAR